MIPSCIAVFLSVGYMPICWARLGLWPRLPELDGLDFFVGMTTCFRVEML